MMADRWPSICWRSAVNRPYYTSSSSRAYHIAIILLVNKAGNPFSRFLGQWSGNRPFAAFVTRWDRLEEIVIGVYRQKMAIEAAEDEFKALWPWLRRQYPQWEAMLRPHWQATRAAGQPVQRDPFRLLLDLGRAADIRGESGWALMQQLPAAREAINRFLVATAEQ
jgi:hypothetical protein